MMLSAPAWSQTGDPVPPIRLGFVEDDTHGILGYGVPYDNIFTTEFGEPDAPWENFLKSNGFSFDPTVKLGNATASATNVFSFDYDGDFSVPIVNSGFRPDDAKIKLGPLYINYNSVSFQLLASDNTNYEVDNRDSGVISIMSSDFDVTLQLTEGLQVSASSAIIWLPFENKAGLDGFGAPRDAYGLGFGVGAGAGLDLSADYAFSIGGWDVVWNGGFTKDRRSYDAQYTYANDLMRDQETFQFEGEDVAGRYRFGNGPQDDRGSRDGEISGFEDTGSSSDDWELTNDVTISRRVPIDQSVYAYLEGAFTNTLREDEDGYLLSDTSERYTVQLTSERENTRFTPFVTYSAIRSYDNRSPDDEMDDWSHILRVGVTGPVTENIFLYADFGYSLTEYHDEDIEDTEQEVYTFGLTHVVNPYLTHAISLRRSVDNDHTLSDSLNYTMTYILGPRLHGYVSYEQSEDFTRNSDKGRGRETSWRQTTLANLTWDYSSRTTLTLEGRHTNTRQYVDNISIGDIEEWRAELRLEYEVSDTLSLTVSAIHTEEERLRSDNAGERLVENLLLLMLTKEL